MLDQFKGFINYSEVEFKKLWEESIIVIDTNILLNFYKYTSKHSTKSLIDILKKLKEDKRLWIPHQVALEYFFNYENNMFKQKEGYMFLENELKKLKANATKSLATVKTNHPYIMTEKFDFFIKNLDESNKQLEDEVWKEIDALPDSKNIHQDLLKLIDGIVGNPYTQNKIDEIEKDGKERYKNDLPPGYKDKGKADKEEYRSYGDIKYQRLYGDLIVWNQIIDKAKDSENSRPVIFITEDSKEDWWHKDGNKIKRAHPFLIQEFYNKTQHNFYMYRTENFVENAIKYLHVNVTKEEFDEVSSEVESIRKAEESMKIKENNYYFINENNYKDILKESNVKINNILEYLPKEKKREAKERITNIISINNKSSKEKDYRETIHWLFLYSLPNLINRVTELALEISMKFDIEDADKFTDRLEFILNNNDTVESGIALLELINEMNNFYENGGLPF